MNKEFNTKFIFKVLGTLLIVESIFLLLVIPIDLFYNEKTSQSFLVSAGIALLVGLIAFLIGKNATTNIGKREGALIVTLTWTLFSAFGMLPFLLTGSIPQLADAFFETMSGFTTTGSTILNNIEELPHAILYSVII